MPHPLRHTEAMKLDPAIRKLLKAANRAEDRLEARSAALIAAQYRSLSLSATEDALRAVLDKPQSVRRRELPKILKLIDEAAKATRTPPDEVWRVMARAVRGRVLSVDEMARLQNPALTFNDPAELEARAVRRQRRLMNGYWAHEQKRFRDDVAGTVREAIRTGMEHDQAVKLLQERVGVSQSRANLIMLDQQRTAAAYADEKRQKQLGIKSFIWLSMFGPTARREHAARHGRIFSWATVSDKPGAAICCRCRGVGVPPSPQKSR